MTRCSMSCVAYLCGHPPLHSHVLQHVTVPPTRAARTHCAGTARAARLLQIAFQTLVLILQPAGGGRSALAALALPSHRVSRCRRAAVALGARGPLERRGRGPELRAHLPQREAHLRAKRSAQPASRQRPRSCGGLLDSDLFDVLRSRRLLVLVLARERHVGRPGSETQTLEPRRRAVRERGARTWCASEHVNHMASTYRVPESTCVGAGRQYTTRSRTCFKFPSEIPGGGAGRERAVAPARARRGADARGPRSVESLGGAAPVPARCNG